MNLEDLFEARLAGEHPEVPEALGDDLRHALAAHEALQFALGETILLPATDADDRVPPQLPADYEIVRELGRGGMGVVYLARQKSLDRLVAVKVLRPGELAFGPMVRRFLDEAKHLARLRHPNLVSVHEVGEASGEPYFSMDYIEGESLADLLRRSRLSPSRALAILKQAAEGVAHAHQTGIIHRDLKPANILIDAAGRAYVTDFGLARNLTDESDRTHSGAVMGTPQYMAPEQARGDTRLVGEATDVHALGAVLYEMLTGRPPYGSDNPMQILVRLVHEEPTPPRRIDPRINRDLETICLKALAKQPAERYATVRAMLEDIRRYETGQPLMTRRPGIGYHVRRIVRRHAKLVAAAASAAILTVALVLVLAPKLFDKSVDELVNWGEYEHGAGRHYQAVHVFHRAFQRASPSQRSDLQLAWRIERCITDVDESREAVNLALEVIDDLPDASFGKYDFLVAQALLTRLRGRYPNWIGSYHYEKGSKRPMVPDEARALMQLVERRLAIALKGPTGTPAERRTCEEMLGLLRDQLAGRLAHVTPTEVQADAAFAAAQDPKSTPTELLACAADEGLTAPVRIRAACKAGEKLEGSGHKEAAFVAYDKAYSLRTRFPFYAMKPEAEPGAAAPAEPPDVDDKRPRDARDAAVADLMRQIKQRNDERWVAEPEECRALRDAYAAWRRLDVQEQPFVPDDLRGGLRVRFVGLSLPPEVKMKIGLSLEPVGRPANTTPLMLPVLTTPIWVGVADGRYRLKKGGRVITGTPAFDHLRTELDIDASQWPAEIEVHGETLDLPPIRLFLPAEVKLLAPAAGAGVDLEQDLFRWTPISGAATYKVGFQLEFNTPTQGGSVLQGSKSLATVETSSTSVCLGLVERKGLYSLPQELAQGCTGIWSVSAYDAQNKSIGRSYRGGRRFFVARGLEKPGD